MALDARVEKRHDYPGVWLNDENNKEEYIDA
jgi:hypothetical protein